jgi:hypothetical protein
MTTDNQSMTTTPIEETQSYSKATNIGRSHPSKQLEKTMIGMKTLSLRPTRSVKRNNSFKPTKKLR